MESSHEVPAAGAPAAPATEGAFLGVGDLLGFAGSVSPAKLALVDGLAEPQYTGHEGGALSVLELRIHGVGGSSPEELLEQTDYVQVGGDSVAQFVRREGDARRIVPWPLEGYWWGGLTSKSAFRALWVLLVPLLFANLAAWATPALPRDKQPGPSLPLTGRCLAVVMRWAGYVLTLVLTASVATSSIDTFGWQCAVVQLSKTGGACRPGWLSWVPAEAGPRMTLFALVPVVVVAVIAYLCHRTLLSYEQWRIQRGVASPAGPDRAAWPLATPGFWHGLRPVRRLQLLHLAGAAGLVSLYLAWVPASHPGWRTIAIIAAFVTVAVPGLLLARPEVGRPGDNPYAVSAGPAAQPDAESPGAGTADPDNGVTGFDWVIGTVLAVSVAVLATLLIVRIWWRPAAPAVPRSPGVLPGDAGIWEGLSVAMAVVVGAAFLLTAVAQVLIARASQEDRGQEATASREGVKSFRPFVGGFLGPFALGLACVTGGIFAAGVNLALPRLLIGTAFRVGPGFTGQSSAAYPLDVTWPLFGFMSGLLVMVVAVFLFAVCLLVYLLRFRARTITASLPAYYADAGEATGSQKRRVAWYWALSRAADFIGLTFAVLSLAGLAGVIAFFVAGHHPFIDTWVVRIGQWAVGAGAVALYGFTVSAFTNLGKRKTIGVLWDVGTFWPRACQPFAPPCYMERSVPELVNRIHGLLARNAESPGGDPAEAAEAAALKALAARLGVDTSRYKGKFRELAPRYDRILVNAYSQGSPIAAAVLAQLPPGEAISLMTVGSPLRRLFARGFPAYFGYDCLTALRDELTEARWRNAVRKSDYIGDFIFDDPYASDKLTPGPVDRPVLDPPSLVPDDGDGVTLPPIHGHLDFWLDPQVAILTEEFIDRVTAPAPPRPAPGHGSPVPRLSSEPLDQPAG